MQLKKLIPAFLALIVLCGCSSGSNDSTKKDNKSNKTETSETVDTKDLTTVKGTMDVPEDLKDKFLTESTVEYTVDKTGLIHTLTFHKVTSEGPIDVENSKNGTLAYLSDDKIDSWKKETEDDSKINDNGFEVSLTLGEKLDSEVSLNMNIDEVGYKATYDFSFNSSKADKTAIQDVKDSLDVKIKDGKITEKSLKKMLEFYYMTYTNE
ncbi:hypothetical protein [Faecalibacillus intestinalis]|uniref:hypothetical protein n=1 Tax=Faecalibacillus intestinalis TaxID=1982626 RepID=UPI002E77A1A5|nr:hypothetical protein [Faecalibacillus intestinalis]MED9807906.1 hypothetical protein [Faecalibacillus intestinalis]